MANNDRPISTEIPLSELWKQPKEFIYWFLDKYYDININKESCADDEWLCVIRYLKSHYVDEFQNPISSFYIQFGDFDKNKDFQPSVGDERFTLSLEKVNHASKFQLWCGRLKKRILPVHYHLWTKAPLLPEEPTIRRIRGDLYYIEEDGETLEYAGIYGNVTFQGADFIVESGLAECSPEFDKVYFGLFDSREHRKRFLFPDMGYHEYSDLLDFFNPPLDLDYLEQTKENRTFYEHYLEDLFISALTSAESKEKLLKFTKSAQILRIAPQIGTILTKISEKGFGAEPNLNQIISLLSEINKKSDQSLEALGDLKNDISDIKSDTNDILKGLSSLTERIDHVRQELIAKTIDQNKFYTAVADVVESAAKNLISPAVQNRIKREFRYLNEEFFKNPDLAKLRSLLYTAEYIYYEQINKDINIDLSTVVIEYAKILESTLQENIGDPMIAEFSRIEKKWKGFQITRNSRVKLVKPESLGSWVFLSKETSNEYSQWILNRYPGDEELAIFLTEHLGKYTEKIRTTRNGSAHRAVYGIEEAKFVRKLFMEEKTELGVTLFEVCVKIILNQPKSDIPF